MGKLEDTYAGALLHFATEKGELGLLFKEVCVLLGKPIVVTDSGFSDDYVSSTLPDFIEYLQCKGRSQNQKGILERFLELARLQLGIIGVEVVSAVPLTNEQLSEMQIRLIKRTRKQIQLLPRVDPTLLGGVRVIAEGMVMDTSIKQQLVQMKEKIYKGVYLSR